MDQHTEQLIDLPFDILLQILGECDVLDTLSLSSVRGWSSSCHPPPLIIVVSQTCKHLLRVADEHQVWFHQARHLQIPIQSGTTPSKSKLKRWVISRTRADVCWIKPRPGKLVVHPFQASTKFVDAHLVPGGEFVVILYETGDVGLNRIGRSKITGGLVPREVARYKERNRGHRPSFWSRLLTETSYGCPVLVWVSSNRRE